MRFLPGQPCLQKRTAGSYQWHGENILAYCSGNSFVVIREGYRLAKTFLLPCDATALAVSADLGRIAVACKQIVRIFALEISFRGDLSVDHLAEFETGLDVKDIAWGSTQLIVLSENKLSVLSSETGAALWSCCLSFCADTVVSRPGPWCSFLLFNSEILLPELWCITQNGQEFTHSRQILLHLCPLQWAIWRNSQNVDSFGDKILITLGTDNFIRYWGPTPAGDNVYGLMWTMKLEPNSLCIPNDSQLIYSTDGAVRARTVVVDEMQLAHQFEPFDITVEEQESLECLRETIYAWYSGSFVYALTPHGLVSLMLDKSNKTLKLCAVLAGHTTSIRRLDRNTEGSYLLSQSWHKESVLWRVQKLDNILTLVRHCEFPYVSPGKVTLVAMNKNMIFAQSSCDLIACRVSKSQQKVDLKAKTHVKDLPAPNQEPLALFVFPSESGHFVSLVFPRYVLSWHYSSLNNSFGERQVDELSEDDEIKKVTQSDPVGSFVTVEPVKQAQHFATLSTKGQISIWTGVSGGNSGTHVGWSSTPIFHSLDSYFAPDETIDRFQLSSTGHLAIATSLRLVIANCSTKVIEQEELLSNFNEKVKDLDWCVTPGGGTLLAVGFESKVIVYCQQRYDYSKTLDAWTKIRELNVSPYTPHKIADSLWLRDCSLVTGCGNQMFLQNATLADDEGKSSKLWNNHGVASALADAKTIVDVNAVLSGPAPLYHPQLLIQLIYFDRIDVVARIFVRLRQQLRFSAVSESTKTYDIDSLLDLDLYDLFSAESLNDNAAEQFFMSEAGTEELCSLLARAKLPYLTQHSQMTLVAVIQSLQMLHGELGSVDNAGDKFLLGFHLFRLHFFTQPSMNMRDSVFALRSRSKAVLLDTVLKSQTGPLTWSFFSSLGLPFWLENGSLCEQTESLARQIFAATRDPVKVSLFYLALKKKTVLLGLWRISASHPEQTKVFKMLSHDFTEPRWKEAALKNAYALMGRHRYEFAASWFLLAGQAMDACSLILSKLNDLPLAILVARIYDGDSGPTMRLINERYLQLGANGPTSAFDRWRAMWGSMIMEDLGSARDAAFAAFGGELGFDATKRWMEDPVLLAMLQRLPAKYRLSQKDESIALLQASDILCRMGCGCVAANIVSNWKFSENETITMTQLPQTGITEQTSSSTTPSEPLQDTGVANLLFGARKPPPEMSMEPDMSAFGF